MEFSYKVFRHDGDTILAISDSSIIGKTFSEGELKIEVSRDFYCGETCSGSDAVKLASSATIINAVGKDVIEILLKNGFVDSESILLIGGIPHAQIITIR